MWKFARTCGIFNDATVTDESGAPFQIGGDTDVTVRNSISISVNNPASLTVTVSSGTYDKFCIISYKRVYD